MAGRPTEPRTRPSAAVPALAAAVPVAGLALLDGGYFATSWGWAALGLSWVATLALVLRDPGRPSVLEAVFLAALAGLAAWMVVSSAWSSASPAILEAERALVYVAGALALAVTAERESFVQVLGGLAVAIAGIAGYALFTRLFPDLTGAYDPDPAYQLSEPYGYWNALGIVVAIGTLLALGFAIRAGSRPRRALAAAALPVLAATLFFTFSRGSVLALAIGVAAAVALDSRRLALVTNGLVLAPVPGVTVWLCSRSDALSRQGFPLEDAARDGHRLAPAIVVLAALSAALSLAASALAGRVRVGRRARLAYAAVLVVLAVAAVGAVLVRVGGPVALVTRGYTAFNAPPPVIEGDLRKRLFSFSGNARADYWRVAWSEYEQNPWLGGGAGSYERYWLRERTTATGVRDVHNVYLEVLAELGPVGLALLMAALASPLAAAIAARGHPLVPAAGGAYVAYLAHAGVDWDWEMTGVTLAALFVGSALVLAARPEPRRRLPRAARWGALVATLALAAFAMVGLVGNGAVGSSASAAAEGRWDEAEAEARKAARWAPWSADPWRWRAEAELGHGDAEAARESFRRAAAKDPDNWELWFGLARASLGTEREQALDRAAALNPLSPDIAALRGSRTP